MSPPPAHAGAHRRLAVAIPLTLVIFAIDLAAPMGYALGFLYLIPLMALLRSRVRWHPLAVAGLSSALVLVDVALRAPSPSGPAGLEFIVVHRALSLGALWVFALLLARNQHLALARDQTDALFHQALEGAPDAMLLVGPTGKIRRANTAALAMFGAERGGLVGEPLSSLIEGADCSTGLAGSGEAKRRDGERFPVECTSSSVQGAGGERLFAIRDISERQRRDERLRAAQRLESVGKLAGGVAHDFNNMLAAITGYAEHVRDGLPAASPARGDLQEILRASARAAALTRQLLAFSRRQVIEPIRLDLNELVRDTERLLSGTVGTDITIRLELGDELGAVVADPSKLEQVLLNLVVNARDAMPQGGVLTVETKRVTFGSSPAPEDPDLVPGDYVRLTVSDTGVGMSEATRERIFEPFFSTKPPGEGTGLGLSTTYGTVKQAGGHIEVRSELGQGTTFELYLPRASGPAQERPRKKPSLHPSRGSELVLLVEDEPSLLRVTARTLRNAGYTVLEAADGAVALAMLDAAERLPELLVTDVVMPELGGLELAAQVGERHPSLRVLFLSGYADNVIVRDGALTARFAFLQKPFSSSEFLLKIREILDAKGGSDSASLRTSA